MPLGDPSSAGAGALPPPPEGPPARPGEVPGLRTAMMSPRPHLPRGSPRPPLAGTLYQGHPRRPCFLSPRMPPRAVPQGSEPACHTFRNDAWHVSTRGAAIRKGRLK